MISRIFTTSLVAFACTFQIAIAVAETSSTPANNMKILGKVFVSFKQSIDPWTGEYQAEILNPLGQAVFEYIPNGFKLHMMMENSEFRTISVFFDKPEYSRDFEPGSREEAIAYAINRTHTSGNKVFHNELMGMQNTEYGMLLTINMDRVFGFTKTNFEASEVQMMPFEVDPELVVKNLKFQNDGAHPSILQYIANTILQGERAEQPAPKKRQPFGFVQESDHVKPIQVCKGLLH